MQKNPKRQYNITSKKANDYVLVYSIIHKAQILQLQLQLAIVKVILGSLSA